MAILPPKAYDQTIKILGPHGPDAVLAIAIFAGVLVAAPYLGLFPCAAFGLVLYAMYGARKVFHERHTERMLRGELEGKQLAITEYCARQQVKLRKKEREKAVALPQPRRRK